VSRARCLHCPRSFPGESVPGGKPKQHLRKARHKEPTGPTSRVPREEFFKLLARRTVGPIIGGATISKKLAFSNLWKHKLPSNPSLLPTYSQRGVARAPDTRLPPLVPAHQLEVATVLPGP
jgi:hypothetical protein